MAPASECSFFDVAPHAKGLPQGPPPLGHRINTQLLTWPWRCTGQHHSTNLQRPPYRETDTPIKEYYGFIPWSLVSRRHHPLERLSHSTSLPSYSYLDFSPAIRILSQVHSSSLKCFWIASCSTGAPRGLLDYQLWIRFFKIVPAQMLPPAHLAEVKPPGIPCMRMRKFIGPSVATPAPSSYR